MRNINILCFMINMFMCGVTSSARKPLGAAYFGFLALFSLFLVLH
jgi:hypothetical protein